MGKKSRFNHIRFDGPSPNAERCQIEWHEMHTSVSVKFIYLQFGRLLFGIGNDANVEVEKSKCKQIVQSLIMLINEWIDRIAYGLHELMQTTQFRFCFHFFFFRIIIFFCSFVVGVCSFVYQFYFGDCCCNWNFHSNFFHRLCIHSTMHSLWTHSIDYVSWLYRGYVDWWPELMGRFEPQIQPMIMRWSNGFRPEVIPSSIE